MSLLRYSALPLSNLEPLLNIMKSKDHILMGESSHGTKEFHIIRFLLTERLLQEENFNFIAVEWDWPDCYQVNLYVQGQSPFNSAREILKRFSRWPRWMWGNAEMADFIEWLRNYNISSGRKIGFYGLDLFGLEGILKISSLQNSLSQCLDPRNNEQVLTPGCEQQLYNFKPSGDPLSLIISDLSEYLRKNRDWNIRENHILKTYQNLVSSYGKGIVWTHNTHVGDNRYIDLPGQLSLGQLLREIYSPERVFLLGMIAYQGEVLAGPEWFGPDLRTVLPPALPGSWEALFHELIGQDAIIKLEPSDEKRPHRAVSAVYRPENDSLQYLLTNLSRRYDAVIYLERSSALNLL